MIELLEFYFLDYYYYVSDWIVRRSSGIRSWVYGNVMEQWARLGAPDRIPVLCGL
jgi:hypothetical protein